MFLKRSRIAAVGVVLVLAAATTAFAAPGDAVTTRGANPARVGAASKKPRASTKPVKVGVFLLSQATLLNSIAGAFERQLRKDLAPRRVSFQVRNAQGQDNLIQSIATQFAQSKDDLFAVAGTPGIIALYQQEKKRPIIGMAMTDPVQAGVAKGRKFSRTNVTGSLGLIPPKEILAEVMKIKPMPKTIGTILDPSNDASNIWLNEFKAAMTAYPGVKLVEAPITGPADISTAAQSLVGRTDTWVMPPDTTVIAGLAAVGSVALTAKVPLIVTAGDSTTPGVLTSIGPNWTALGRLAARPAAAILKHGKKPGKVRFVGPGRAIFSVNKQTASSLTVTLP